MCSRKEFDLMPHYRRRRTIPVEVTIAWSWTFGRSYANSVCGFLGAKVAYICNGRRLANQPHILDRTAEMSGISSEAFRARVSITSG
jgi:hypothetical protein